LLLAVEVPPRTLTLASQAFGDNETGRVVETDLVFSHSRAIEGKVSLSLSGRHNADPPSVMFGDDERKQGRHCPEKFETMRAWFRFQQTDQT
jgi:hypothetical protein